MAIPQIEQPQTEDKQTEISPSVGRVSAFLASLGIENRASKTVLVFLLIIVFFSATVAFLMLPPISFPQNKMITIKSGATVTKVSALLKTENLIRSRNLFELCIRVAGGEKPVIAGDYLFKEPIGACAIATRIARGVSGVPSARITIPEGMSNKEIAELLGKTLVKFDSVVFLDVARAKEGYLFPDTYFFPSAVVAQGVEMIMSENFKKKLDPWNGVIESSRHSLRDIIIMASILEKEATTEEDKKMVSGILWKRISIGMPLQVDATFLYLLGKKSSELTLADLQMKSAYNTYRNKGLPAGPINNPGIIAIRAAIEPTASSYLYYLSDNDGAMHYAKTFEEHKANKQKYLK